MQGEEMKYSILMPYYRRLDQLQSTLQSFKYFYPYRNDYEIILIIDNKIDSKDSIGLNELLSVFPSLSIAPVLGTPDDSYSPATSYNIGANLASGEYIILTNPENMHTVDVLRGLDEEFEKSKDSYVVCSCLSIQDKYLPVDQINDAKGQWYQHSIHRNIGAHFCSAISRENYFKVGGFSEEFSAGIGFDDDDFRNKVQAAGIPFVYRDDLITLHLNHDKDPVNIPKYMQNKELYNAKWGKDSFRAEQLLVSPTTYYARKILDV